MGGGHHITREDYDIEKLIYWINRIQDTYELKVYLEPGEAVALNTGFLVASVLDVVDNGIQNVILDTSAACHMPDVLEMPYRPEIIGAGITFREAFYLSPGWANLSGRGYNWRLCVSSTT